jgi:hypothetical protein
MDKIPEIELLAVMALGYVLQWARAPKHIPSWASWAGVAVAAALLYWWMTPSAVSSIATDWRRTLVAVITFALSAQGAARGAQDMKAAPKTDTI